MSSTWKFIFKTYIRIICRKYGFFLLFGIFVIFFQAFCSYYIYQEIDLDHSIHKHKLDIVHSDSSVFINENLQTNKLTKRSQALLEYFSKYANKVTFDSPGRIIESIVQSCNNEDMPKEASSAIQRAKTLHCKEKIANISCAIQKGTFYPERLSSLCPSDGHVKGAYIGCFIDDRENRILSGHATQLKRNSPLICADLCFQRGYIYAGVEYSKECFCGNQELQDLLRVPDSECDMTCIGDLSNKYICGGYLRISIVETGLTRINTQALKRPATMNGPPVRIAYILIVNGRALRQVYRLIKALYHKDHCFFIHVDARQKYLYRELLHLETLYPNILLSRKRFSSIWGGTSLLSVLLHCMTELLKKDDWLWDFVINLSETDFPIKTNTLLTQFLTANKDRNFLKSHGHDTNKFIQKQGLVRTFLECENHMWRIGERSLPLGIRMDGGSDWVCLNRDFVKYITQNRDELVTGLLKFFSYTLLPGESFFHTVLRNSIFCQSFVDNNLHVTNWKRKLGCQCQYKHIVDWCGCSPNDFTLEDWPKIEASKSRNLFFARKFEAVISLRTINKVDQWLYGSYDAATPNLKSYWENIFHHEDSASDVNDVDLTLYHAATRSSRLVMKDYREVNKNLMKSYNNADNASHISCEIIPSTVVQAFSYHLNDLSEGILVEFKGQAQSDKQSLKIQTWIQPKITTRILRSATLHHRLKNVEVNSNIDLKEQIFRDFGKCFGPESSIVVMTWWHSSDLLEDLLRKETEPEKTLHPKIILKDSVGAAAGEVELSVSEEEQMVDHTFNLNKPLRPGMWKAYIVLDNKIIATKEFAVLPVQFSHGRQISVAEGRALHGGPETPYSEVNLDSISNSVTNAVPFPGNTNLLRAAKEKAILYGPELLQWIDEVFESAYVVKGICHVPKEGVHSCISRTYFSCADVAWSSYSPDPKSSLGKVDNVTGRLIDHYRIVTDS